MDTTTFNVPSISCSICSNKIQEGLKAVDGIQNVSIDLKSQTVKVDYDSGRINPQEIRYGIVTQGYEVIQ